MRIYPLILCGGSGTRLWPASRPSRPKQFIPLVGGRSLFQDTVARLQGFEGAQPPVVVAGEAHLGYVAAQMRALGVVGTVLVEPEGRDSAPAIAAAARFIQSRDPEGIAVVVASDHHIPDAEAFRQSVLVAARGAALGSIVTFGVAPTAPTSAYGYIQQGAALSGAPGVHAVARFVEKPDAATAQRYVDDGYLWNSGNFVFSAATLVAELRRYAPALLDPVDLSLTEAAVDGIAVRLSPAFRTAPKISIDYAVMENTAHAAVAPVSFAWSDLGAWDAVWAASDRDAAGNAVAGDGLLVGCADSLIRSSGTLVVGVGLNRIAVICEPDAVLVCDLDSSQQVKAVVDRLKADRRPEVDLPAAVDVRPELGRWLRVSALPLWWSLGADHAGGGFYEALTLSGDAHPAPRRARVQARQTYVYATAALRGWAGPAHTAVEHGLSYFLDRYSRPDGLFRTLVGADGEPVDDAAILYDQAFALFALAAAAQAAPARRDGLHDRALLVLDALGQDWTAPAGGFIERTGRSPYQSNPHMHLLEASLAWAEAGGPAVWETQAGRLVELCLTRFIDPASGALREFFAADWSPAPGVDGRIVEPGHQFEWAWLLERWGRRTGDARARKAAARLFDVGVGGLREGVAVNALLDDGSVHDAEARLWPQTEWMKAAHILGRDADCAAAARALRLYLPDSPAGLWRDRRRPGGSFVDEPAPASSFYHIACALFETEAGRPITS